MTMHQREYAVALRQHKNGIMLHTLFYANEVRDVPEYGAQSGVEVKDRELEMAEKLIQALAQPFEPDKLEDEYQKKLLELVEAKGAGRLITGVPHKQIAAVGDLMAALQKSLSAKSPASIAKRKPIPISHRKKAAS